MALVVFDYQRHFYLEGGVMDANERTFRSLEWPDLPKRKDPEKEKPEQTCEDKSDSVS
jgi:hypothetical protein